MASPASHVPWNNFLLFWAMSSTIYFIRHGETAWNKELRLQGQMEIPLNEVGQKQAVLTGRELRRRMHHQQFTAVSSNNARAKMTCERVCNEIGISFETNAILQERGSEKWEGKLLSDVVKLYGWQNLEEPKFCTLLDKITESSGESKEIFLRRMQKCCEYIEELARQKKNLIVVSHGLTLRAIIQLLCFEKDYRNIDYKNYRYCVRTTILFQV